jgi:hypothetical protein
LSATGLAALGTPMAAIADPLSNAEPAGSAYTETQQIQSAIEPGLVPSRDPVTVAVWLQTRGYALSFRMPTDGSMIVGWFLGPAPTPGRTHASPHAKVIAFGAARLSEGVFQAVALKSTPTGRALIQTVRTLSLTAVATFTATDGTSVTVQKAFTL